MKKGDQLDRKCKGGWDRVGWSSGKLEAEWEDLGEKVIGVGAEWERNVLQ